MALSDNVKKYEATPKYRLSINRATEAIRRGTSKVDLSALLVERTARPNLYDTKPHDTIETKYTRKT